MSSSSSSSSSSSGWNAGGPSKLTSKQQRKLALASLKSARSGRLSSALDEVLRDDRGDARNGDVYDVLDEEEYRDYVERRREREDFVVDDGELASRYGHGSPPAPSQPMAVLTIVMFLCY